MKLTSYIGSDGRESCGIVTGSIDAPEGIIDLGPRYTSLRDLIADGADGLAYAKSRADAAPAIAFADAKLLPVVPKPDKILCVGVNFASHVKETGRETPDKPMIFMRFAESQTGAHQDMLCPKVSERFDYEGELAVIIGKRCRYVPEDKALDYVAGYSCYNDGSVRDWQKHSQQFGPGKNFPQTGAFGPWMVTADELTDISAQSLKTRLNGQEVQTATLDDLIFDVPALVAYCSSFITLEPGDVIICGTTGGVGAFHNPPLWMKEGDTVEVEISGIGILRNGIAKEADDFDIV
ncbi:fumarylacetoacetate hydrolase family protein [Sphingopyxis flava]|uniref:2-keto-4-pentenoate hydratase/2-oxohepta-3-ene-1,7-dioic acid hydratase (Catechol pathway) n=1 Tax=Sphingopyxis flava TaxID=1507287 RepID=A0A1T5E746_9SPHN|nr:fumarylacetoacetate hydrolase family protein [Sphingopyxis flava]SKB79777.1 2-keto-4-pentenoate hydratase/2-oxohepta-3-ene-1,7-dioic acid hydratase (catechol pathway) [Sphingopyxis flava]